MLAIMIHHANNLEQVADAVRHCLVLINSVLNNMHGGVHAIFLPNVETNNPTLGLL
jgi:hypothetical protein